MIGETWAFSYETFQCLCRISTNTISIRKSLHIYLTWIYNLLLAVGG